VDGEQRAALACPQCKETSGMRVAYGEDDEVVMDEQAT
jgi:hypothetical protein